MVHGLFTTSAQFYHLEHMLKDPRFFIQMLKLFFGFNPYRTYLNIHL